MSGDDCLLDALRGQQLVVDVILPAHGWRCAVVLIVCVNVEFVKYTGGWFGSKRRRRASDRNRSVALFCVCVSRFWGSDSNDEMTTGLTKNARVSVNVSWRKLTVTAMKNVSSSGPVRFVFLDWNEFRWMMMMIMTLISMLERLYIDWERICEKREYNTGKMTVYLKLCSQFIRRCRLWKLPYSEKFWRFVEITLLQRTRVIPNLEWIQNGLHTRLKYEIGFTSNMKIVLWLIWNFTSYFVVLTTSVEISTAFRRFQTSQIWQYEIQRAFVYEIQRATAIFCRNLLTEVLTDCHRVQRDETCRWKTCEEVRYLRRYLCIWKKITNWTLNILS